VEKRNEYRRKFR